VSEGAGGETASAPAGPSVGRVLATASLILTIAALGSRLLGWVRLLVIGSQFGASRELDAYFAAFRIPDAIFQLVVAGALSAALIPVFSSYRARGEETEAWRLASSVINLVVIALSGFSLLMAILAPIVVPIVAPPLRERHGDVPLLVAHFIRRYSLEFNKPVTSMSPEALAALEEYGWPGNVRELQNVIERSVALVEGVVIQLQDLPLDLMLPDHGARARQAETLPLQEACERFERQIVLRVLERAAWNQTEAARLLGVHRNTLQQRLARWNLQRPGSEG